MINKVIIFFRNALKKLNNVIKNNDSIRKAIIFSIICFLLYFILGSIYTYYINSIGKYNLFFGTDSPRVLIDLTQISGGHQRTAVHPLFVIFFQPIVHIFNAIIGNKLLASILLQSIISAISICFLYLLFGKLKLDKKIQKLLLIICALSFGNIVFNATIETYSFAQLFIIILLYFTMCKKNENLNNWDITILVLLGIANLGVTITNYFVYILLLLYLIGFNKKLKLSKKLFLLFIIVLLSCTISIAISEVQAVLFSESSLFFKDNLYGFLSGSSKELNYVEQYSIANIFNQIKAVFSYGFFAPKLELTQDVHNLVLSFGNMYLFQKIFMVVTFTLMIGALITFIKNEYKKILNHKFLIILVLCFSFNFILHIFYGNSESFLYTLHYQSILVLIFGYVLQYILNVSNKKHNSIFNKAAIIYLIVFIIVEILSNAMGLYEMYYLLKDLCGFSKDISCFVYIIPFVSILLIIFLLNIDLKRKMICIISLFFIILFGYNILNNKNQYVSEEYRDSYQEYINQINLLKSDFNVKVAFKNQDTDFYFFGMGNRVKLMYQNGKLYNLENNEVIVSYEIIKETIIPNEYTVIMQTKDNEIIKIYENEDSIYIENGDKRINLDENAVKVKLPEFDEYKYSEVLKVLHHELLFNISDSVFKPNILVYTDGWYRDAMMGAMVLDITDNTELIKEWVDRIDKIYDLQNGREETDNLGELLYLIHITNSNNKIKKDVIKEIERIKEENDNYLAGYTDGRLLSYYPTVIAKYALELSNIELELDIPSYDYYSSLTWFYEDNIKTNDYYDKINYPYIGWAAYHTSENAVLYMCDDIYPISYEKNGGYANYDLMPKNITYYKVIELSPTHVWDAAEKFLFLIEQN